MDSDVVLTRDVDLTDRRSTVHVPQGRYSKVLVWDNGAVLAKVNCNAEPVLLSADQYELLLAAERSQPLASAVKPGLPSMPRLPSRSTMPRLPGRPSMLRVPSIPRLPSMPRLVWRPKLGTGRGAAGKILLPFLLFESFLIRLLSLGIEAACVGCDALPFSQWSFRDADA